MNISNRLFCFLMLIIVAILILVIVKLILLFADYARRKYEKYLLELQMNNKPPETTNDDSETTILGVFTSAELAHNFIKEWIRNNEISDGMEFFDEIHQLNPEA